MKANPGNGVEPVGEREPGAVEGTISCDPDEATLTLARNTLCALKGRMAAKISLECTLNFGSKPDERLAQVIEGIKVSYNRVDGGAQLQEVLVLADMNGMRESTWETDGLANSTHLVLLKLNAGGAALAVLKIFGGTVGAINEGGPRELFDTACRILRQGNCIFPNLYGEFTNASSNNTDAILYEYIPGPTLKAAFKSGLVSWDEGIELLEGTHRALLANDLVTWDNKATNYIVGNGVVIDPDSVSSLSPDDWRWTKTPDAELALTPVDTDGYSPSEDLLEFCADAEISADKTMAQGALDYCTVERAIADGLLPQEKFADLCQEYVEYLEGRGLALSNADLDRNTFLVVPSPAGGVMIRGGDVDKEEYADEPDSLLTSSELHQRLLEQLQSCASAVIP